MRGSLYSVSDKAVYDAINQAKITNGELRDIFLSRGVIISSETKRDKLATYFSLFPHSYYDYKRLADILGVNTRKEKSTSTTLEVDFDREVIKAVSEEFINKLTSFGAKCDIEKPENNIYNIKIQYRELNLGNSEFKQLTKKEAIIALELNDQTLKIRHPQNSTVEEWKALFINMLEKEIESEIVVTDINLENISNHRKITNFFITLINGIDGYTLQDVSDVYVYHPKGNEDNDDEDEFSDSTEIGVHISKASLKGENVLKSEEISQLYKKSFYISKIIWFSKQDIVDGDIYEFEAQFLDAENKNDFSYLVRGYYPYKGFNEHLKTRKSLSKIEELELTRKLENSALNAFNIVNGNNADEI